MTSPIHKGGDPSLGSDLRIIMSNGREHFVMLVHGIEKKEKLERLPLYQPCPGGWPTGDAAA